MAGEIEAQSIAAQTLMPGGAFIGEISWITRVHVHRSDLAPYCNAVDLREWDDVMSMASEARIILKT